MRPVYKNTSHGITEEQWNSTCYMLCTDIVTGIICSCLMVIALTKTCKKQKFKCESESTHQKY